MLVAAAFCPHPPLLVPAVAGATTAVHRRLRAACAGAVAELVAESPDVIVVVGAGPRTYHADRRAGGTLRGYGPDVAYGGPEIGLPFAATIGAYLLDSSGWRGRRGYQVLDKRATAQQAARVGRGLVAETVGRMALLVIGDGSVRRSSTGPGHLDRRADAYDAQVSAALADADTVALLSLDEQPTDDLWVAGRVAWQAAAGALRGNLNVEAVVRYDAAPFGVGYFVASWRLRG